MFLDSNYDVLEFFPPANGMNRSIARDILPANFAYVFENVTPVPAGETHIRFGTKKVTPRRLMNGAYTVLEAFPFQKANGGKQIVAYLQYFLPYINPTNLAQVDLDKFRFTPNNQGTFFELDTPIQIQYNAGEGVVSASSYIRKIQQENNGDLTITLKDPALQENATIQGFSITRGKIVVYDFSTDDLIPGQGADNLHTGVVPRSITYLSTLLMCNGVDPVYSWDGTTFERVYDFVKEQAAAFNRISPVRFSFTVTPTAFDISKYQNNATIQLVINGASATLSVSEAEASIANNTVTLVIAGQLPAFTGRDRIDLFYKDYPPAFSYMHVAHDRIFALPPGAVSLSYRSPQDALRVYYTYRPKTLTNWFNENTKTVPSIDISAKHESPDNLEAVVSIGEYLVFMGRKKTQLWLGQDPINIDSPVALRFASLLPVGIFHGNLWAELPNDTYFISQNGNLSFGTLNIAKQFAATSVDAVDPLVRSYIGAASESNEAYRACRSFKYPSGSFCGFKIGFNPPLIGFYSTNIYAWSLFSGDFRFSTAFLTTLDNALYLFIDGTIYQYADGTSTPAFYADRDGANIINFIWSFPVTKLKGRKYSNQYYEIDLIYSSSFVLNQGNNISMAIDGDMRETFSVENDYSFQLRGDRFETVPLLETSEDPNEPPASSTGMRLAVPFERRIERFKFVSSKFLVTIFGQAKNGPVSFNGLKLFGRIERKK